MKIKMNRPAAVTHHRKPTGNLVPCPGEAHRPEVAGMIDNCGLCAPRWGLVEETAPIDLDAARKVGGDVPYAELTDAEYAEVEYDILCGLAVDMTVRATFKWGSRSYSVARYLGAAKAVSA